MASLGHRAFGDGGRLRDLTGDFLNGTGQLLGRGGDGLNVGRGLFGGAGDRGGAFVGAVGDFRHGGRGLFHFHGGIGQRTQQVGHVRVEFAGQAFDMTAAFLAATGGFLFAGGHLVGLDHAFLEHQDRTGHVADFVAVIGARNVHGLIAAGQGLHGRRQGRDGAGDAGADQPGGKTAQDDADHGHDQGNDQRGLHGLAGGRAQFFLNLLDRVFQAVHVGGDVGAQETDGSHDQFIPRQVDFVDLFDRGLIVVMHLHDLGDHGLVVFLENLAVQLLQVLAKLVGGLHGVVVFGGIVGGHELVRMQAHQQQGALRLGGGVGGRDFGIVVGALHQIGQAGFHIRPDHVHAAFDDGITLGLQLRHLVECSLILGQVLHRRGDRLLLFRIHDVGVEVLHRCDGGLDPVGEVADGFFGRL